MTFRHRLGLGFVKGLLKVYLLGQPWGKVQCKRSPNNAYGLISFVGLTTVQPFWSQLVTTAIMLVNSDPAIIIGKSFFSGDEVWNYVFNSVGIRCKFPCD